MSNHRFGPAVRDDGVSFRLYAPAQKAVTLVIEGRPDIAMTRDDIGFFQADAAGAKPGDRYWFRVAQGLRPDPVSHYQPDGPLAASQVIDGRRFQWTDRDWCGPGPTHRQVIYEMHVGTFTTEGTWDAAARHLKRLADLGITILEIMPIAEFAGTFGWGYDGVNLFAPSHLYGDPDAVRRFVDHAHRLNLAIILDVVYNHFGPEGNFIHEFSPTFLGQPGEWGELLNFDGPGAGEVRAFVIENAAYWIRDYHFDGLRFDATQAILDHSPEHIVAEICRAARAAAGERNIFLVAESEPQETRLLRHGGAYSDGLDALWSEDWHHAAYVALTGRRDAYFTDYRGDAPEFAAMARHGTLYQGQWYSWQTQPRGGYALHLPASSFVHFLENHDQVANTGIGVRLCQEVDPGLWRAFTALLLLGPALPMLFQGQEYGSSRPFTYFADHQGDLGAAVETGRLDFLAQFPALSRAEMRGRLPRPGDRDAFDRCKLSDEERERPGSIVRLHRDLLRIRREDTVLAAVGTPDVVVESSAPTPALVVVRYIAAAGHRLLIANLADDHFSPMNEPLFAPVPGGHWQLCWSSEHADYGGLSSVPFVEADQWLLQGRSAIWLASAATDELAAKIGTAHAGVVVNPQGA